MTPSIVELSRYRDVAVEAAKAGASELEHWRRKFQVREKARADLVTDADHASQAAVKKILLDRFPEHLFLGEEEAFGKSLDSLRTPTDAPPVWIVDPLDGTVNYVHDVPVYCVSIGLWYQGRAIVGVIYDPRARELYTAYQGGGAFLNGERMNVSAAGILGDSLLSTGFPANAEAQNRNLDAWRKVSAHCQAVRRSGSSALNLAYVAAGRFDGYWAYDNYAWDVLAGVALIQEAGGAVTACDGSPFDPFRMDLCATNGAIQNDLLTALRQPA